MTAIASLGMDTLRRRAGAAWLMGRTRHARLVLGMLALMRGRIADAIAALWRWQPHSRLRRLSRCGAGAAGAAPAERNAPAARWPGIIPNGSMRALVGGFRRMIARRKCKALATRRAGGYRAQHAQDGPNPLQDMLATRTGGGTAACAAGLRMPAPGLTRARTRPCQSEPEFIKGFIRDPGRGLAASPRAPAPPPR